MDLNHYQRKARNTAIYPKDSAVVYPILGLAGEVGEFANKYKKVLRDGIELDRTAAGKELGDILWYLANIASDLDMSLDYIATTNIEKLQDRADRGVLGGNGDDR